MKKRITTSRRGEKNAFKNQGPTTSAKTAGRENRKKNETKK